MQQNLVFFLNPEPVHANDFPDTSNSYGSKLMNRFFINEDDQCECYGVYKLQLLPTTSAASMAVNETLIVVKIYEYIASIGTGTAFERAVFVIVLLIFEVLADFI